MIPDGRKNEGSSGKLVRPLFARQRFSPCSGEGTENSVPSAPDCERSQSNWLLRGFPVFPGRTGCQRPALIVAPRREDIGRNGASRNRPGGSEADTDEGGRASYDLRINMERVRGACLGWVRNGLYVIAGMGVSDIFKSCERLSGLFANRRRERSVLCRGFRKWCWTAKVTRGVAVVANCL
jgi:hypothetical protein